MLLSEAYDKVTEELVEGARREFSNIEGSEPISPELVAAKLSDLRTVLESYTFDDALKDFIDQRSKKKAAVMITEASDEEIKQDPTAVFERLTDGLWERWIKDFLTLFAMGYTFFGPENAEVAKDKEGFMKLCREIDRSLVEIQIARFRSDYLLCERIEGRLHNAAGFITAMYNMTGVPPTKFAIRDWFHRVLAIISFDCFVAGAKVRELLEEEATFESMMKEMDE